MELVKKNDFIELVFTGKANGSVFDSNDPELLKELDPKATPQKLIVSIGNGMVVKGLDNALEGKEIGKSYEIPVSSDQAFGPRQKSMIKTIPLSIFTAQKMSPQAGMTLALDGMLARVSAVSGSRVIVDFNNPLAGKDLVYTVKMVRFVEDVKERSESFFSFFFKFTPDFEVKESVVVKGPKPLEPFILAFAKRFEDLVGKKLTFELVEKKVEEKTISEEVGTQQSL